MYRPQSLMVEKTRELNSNLKDFREEHKTYSSNSEWWGENEEDILKSQLILNHVNSYIDNRDIEEIVSEPEALSWIKNKLLSVYVLIKNSGYTAEELIETLSETIKQIQSRANFITTPNGDLIEPGKRDTERELCQKELAISKIQQTQNLNPSSVLLPDVGPV